MLPIQWAFGRLNIAFCILAIPFYITKQQQLQKHTHTQRQGNHIQYYDHLYKKKQQ